MAQLNQLKRRIEYLEHHRKEANTRLLIYSIAEDGDKIDHAYDAWGTAWHRGPKECHSAFLERIEASAMSGKSSNIVYGFPIGTDI